MLRPLSSPVYYVPDVDIDVSSTVHRILQLDDETKSHDVIILNNSSSVIDGCHGAKVTSVTSYVTELYRKMKLHGNERETILSYEDCLIAMQLTLAEAQKQECGDFDVETSEVLQTAKYVLRKKMGQNVTFDSDYDAEKMNHFYTNYTDFLTKCNCVDLGDIYQRVKIFLESSEKATTSSGEKCKFIIIGDQITEYEKNLMQLLLSNQKLFVVSFESSLEESHNNLSDLPLSVEEQPWSEVHLGKTGDLSPLNRTQNVSVTEIHVRKVVFAYLSLLVNTRNDIALSRCLNTPDRELDHKAFTALKRAAKDKNMSICQTAESFVLRVRLGASGYAPNDDNPIAPYIKGLSEFINVIHKLQTIIEEDPNASSGMRRILKVIKAVLYKSKDQTLRKSSIDSIFEKLYGDVDELCTATKLCTGSPCLSVSNGGSIAGRHIVKTLRLLLDRESCQKMSCSTVDILTDTYSSQKTPIRFPSVLSQFRSPDLTNEDEPENVSLKERVLQKVSEKKTSLKRMGYKSCMAWADEDSLTDAAPELMIYQDSLSPVNHHDSPVNQTNPDDDKTEKRKELKKRILEEIGDDEISDCDDKDETKETGNKKKRQKKDESNEKNVIKAKENNKSKKPTQKSGARKTKKKLMPLQKGQKQMTDFFRM